MRIAIIAIFVKDHSMSARVNQILHDYGNYIYGRFGLPNIEEELNIITLVMKAPQPDISAMTGKLGSLKGVCAKANYAPI